MEISLPLIMLLIAAPSLAMENSWFEDSLESSTESIELGDSIFQKKAKRLPAPNGLADYQHFYPYIPVTTVLTKAEPCKHCGVRLKTMDAHLRKCGFIYVTTVKNRNLLGAH
ncbi:MAG TPA: hypothetical protein VHO47_02170 [Candidatus Babeliales bacterium]|nr:hypothetical protein [Candidatus Babeliales bacterium]